MPRHRLREPFVFFVDECLGRHVVPDALRKAIDPHERVEIAPAGTEDIAWLPLVGKKGWVCLTKDRRLSRVPNELDALLHASAAVFMLGDASGSEHVRRIILALGVIRRVLRVRDVPIIARVDSDGSIVVLYERGQRLATPRRVMRKSSEGAQSPKRAKSRPRRRK